MFGIPYEKVIFQSELDQSEIFTRLEKTITRPLWFKFPPKEKDFVGTIFQDGFRIYRNIRHQNTYLPTLTGKIRKSEKGSQIEIVMTLHPVAVLIMAGIFLFTFRVLFIPGGDEGFRFLPLSIAIIFHLGMCLVGFNPEVSRAKKLLQEILEIK